MSTTSPPRTAPTAPPADDRRVALMSLAHLEQVVAIDSQSDESSDTIPTTGGQRVLAEHVAAFFTHLGATVERDHHANVIATFAGRGAAAADPPLALMVHLDTARGTRAVPRLHVTEGWDGAPIAFPANPSIQAGVATYPDLAAFVGHDVVHGPGDAPFGLDDKLGLAHLMTLATLLAEDPAAPHPPLLLIGRPDEEVGRMEAVMGLAELLAARGVRSGYTVDGILPFEVNVENFNAAHATVRLPDRRRDLDRGAVAVTVHVGGVNTHGATAHAEGSRSATRLAAELLAALGPDATPLRFTSDAVRDCDAELALALPADGAAARVEAACREVIGPHIVRGASYRVTPVADEPERVQSAATHDMLAFVAALLASEPGFPIAAEDSTGRDGYSAPYRARPTADGAELDVRIRDFDPAGLEARKRQLVDLVGALPGVSIEVRDQYVNMGPQLADRPELVTWARDAARAIGVTAPVMPIRGGTGVDPFLERGVAIANLGTGYFAPESEKELTTLDLMARHARWLFALVTSVRERRGTR